MQKTKLGVSVGVLGAAIYLSTLFGGYIAAILLAGYALLMEENVWLKRMAVKAIVLMFAFSLLIALIDIIPDFFGLIASFLDIFEAEFSLLVLNNIFSFITSVVLFVKTILVLVLGAKALSQSTIRLPLIDSMVGKYMD